MFRSIWSKSLRDYRVPILAWGIGLALLMFVGYATATTLNDGTVLVVGGQYWNGSITTYSASAEIFHPGTGTFELLSSTMSTARSVPLPNLGWEQL